MGHSDCSHSVVGRHRLSLERQNEMGNLKRTKLTLGARFMILFAGVTGIMVVGSALLLPVLAQSHSTVTGSPVCRAKLNLAGEAAESGMAIWRDQKDAVQAESLLKEVIFLDPINPTIKFMLSSHLGCCATWKLPMRRERMPRNIGLNRS